MSEADRMVEAMRPYKRLFSVGDKVTLPPSYKIWFCEVATVVDVWPDHPYDSARDRPTMRIRYTEEGTRNFVDFICNAEVGEECKYA